jgi:hypothetical protein
MADHQCAQRPALQTAAPDDRLRPSAGPLTASYWSTIITQLVADKGLRRMGSKD